MKTKVSISQRKLRALARRALRVVERHKELDVGVATVGVTLVPAAEAYIKRYDAAVKEQVSKGRQMAEGRQSVADLAEQLRKCLAVVRYVFPTFDASQLDGDVEVPDRLIADARKVIELLSEAGDAVQQGKAMLEALQAVTEKADAQWAHAQTARVALQQSQGEVRELARVINQELIALRGFLRVALGTSHLDFQMLRATRSNNPEATEEEDTVVEEDDDVEAPAQPVTVGAAA